MLRLSKGWAFAVVYFLLPISALLPLILYGTATGSNNWLVPPEKVDIGGYLNISNVNIFVPSNGKLGMQTFCPNTAPAVVQEHFIRTGQILKSSDIPDPPCYWMEPSCEIQYCVYNTTQTGGSVGICSKFDVFDPAQALPDDVMFNALYRIIDGFPGGGSCSAYRSARVFHYIAFTFAAVALIFSLAIMALFPVAKMSPSLEGIISLSATFAMSSHVLAFFFSMINICIWTINVTNAATESAYRSSGFWIEVAACVSALVLAPVPMLVRLCKSPDLPRRDSGIDHEVGGAKGVSVSISDKDRLGIEMQQVVRDRDAKAALESEIATKNSELQALRFSLDQKEQQLAGLGGVEAVAAERKKAAALEADLKSKATEIEDLRQQIEAKDAELQQLRGTVREKDDEITRMLRDAFESEIEAEAVDLHRGQPPDESEALAGTNSSAIFKDSQGMDAAPAEAEAVQLLEPAEPEP